MVESIISQDRVIDELLYSIQNRENTIEGWAQNDDLCSKKGVNS
jgi:hypothetical protein